MSEQFESVNKSGICWFELSIERGERGLELFARAEPRIEKFMVSLGNGGRDGIEIYGKSWFPLGEGNLLVYRMSDELPFSDTPRTYTISNPANVLEIGRDDLVNLSFLRFVGIGTPEGVRFGISGPFSKEYTRNLSARIITEVKNLVKEFIAPIDITLRISSQEA